jgi:hypothetical protein
MNNAMRWDRNYASVLSFAKEQGHLNLPSTNRETRRLLNWLRGQKKRVRMPNCQKEKFVGLLTLYEFNQQSQVEHAREVWDTMFNKLLAHCETYCDFVVPIDDDKTLKAWIHYQRQRAKQGKLPEERRKKLVEIDFEFECNSKRKETSFSAKQIMQWDTIYEQLAEFSQSHGHCVVPCHYEANLRLGRWVKNNAMISRKTSWTESAKSLWTSWALPGL